MEIFNKNIINDKKAIIFCDGDKIIDSVTFRQLKGYSSILKDFFSKNIIEPNNCIALCMTHNLYLPSIIISIHELQHSFMFISIDEDFLDTLNNLGIVWVVSFDSNIENLEKVSTINLGQSELFLFKYLIDRTVKYDFRDIFYVICTSGTTGDKKYVRVENRCIEDNVEHLSKKMDVNETDIIYFGTPLTFDPAMIELLLAIYASACLLIVSPICKINTTALYKTLFPTSNKENPGITFLQIVPSLFMRWTNDQIKNILLNPKLKTLAFGGEPFPNNILNYEKISNLRIFNLYGITEVSCWATIHEIVDNNDISIGDVIGDTIIEIRDEIGNHVDEGEIFIGSNTRICYINDEDKTLSLPVYRGTGDLGRKSDGKILYISRKINVIKRFGLKVSLEKMEKIIIEITELPNKSIWCREKSKLLTFFIITDLLNKEKKMKIIDKIRVQCLHNLPKEYYPDYIDIIPKFPVTSHGKLDKKCLESYYLNREVSEKNLGDVFKILVCQYFGLNCKQFNDSLDKKFMEIGGNSIIAMMIIEELFENFSDDQRKSQVVAMLFEDKLRKCHDFLTNITCKMKRKNEEICTNRRKIKKSNFFIRVKWTYNFSACVDAPPVTFKYKERILVAVGSFSEMFAVIDPETGKEISKFKLEGAVESSALFIEPHYLCVGCFDNNMYCLDFEHSSIKWKFSTEDVIKSTPIYCEIKSSIIFGSSDKNVYCVKVENGVCEWKTPVFEGVKSSPIYHDDKIYIATIQGTVLCLTIHGEIIWKYKGESFIFGTPSIIQGNILIANVLGMIICLDCNGVEKWKLKRNGHIFSSLIAFENNKVLFNCHDSNLHVVEIINGNIGRSNEISLNDVSSSTPFISLMDGKATVITACNNGSICVIDFHTLEILIEFELPAQVFSSPVFDSGNIYVGCRDNNLYCLEIINKNL